MSLQHGSKMQRMVSPKPRSTPHALALSTPPRNRGRSMSERVEGSLAFGSIADMELTSETPDKVKARNHPFSENLLSLHEEAADDTCRSKVAPAQPPEPSPATIANPSLRADAIEFVPLGWPVPSPHMQKVPQAACTPPDARWAFPLVPPPLPQELTMQLQMLTMMDASMLRLPIPIMAPPGLRSFAPSSDASPQQSAAPRRELSTEEAATLNGLRQLDAFFEPFSLQHNRHLLATISRKASRGPVALKPSDCRGPWKKEALADLWFDVEDLTGLGENIQKLLTYLSSLPEKQAVQAVERAALRNLHRNAENSWKMQSPPEIRCFIPAAHASRNLVATAVRALLAERKPNGQGVAAASPHGIVSVLSYSIADPMRDRSAFGQQRRKRLLQQLRLCHADILCLQGLDPVRGAGPKFTASLEEDGYMLSYSVAVEADSGTVKQPPRDQANCILWRKDRWAHLRNVDRDLKGSSMIVDLASRQDPKVVVRVGCIRPQLDDCTTLNQLALATAPAVKKRSKTLPCIVCADLSNLGGAEAFSLYPGLADMRSAPIEVLGEDLSAPSLLPRDQPGIDSRALQQLWRPDTVLFQGVELICTLGGHTEGYLKTMSLGNVQQQFPAGHLPIVTSFLASTSVDAFSWQ